MQTHEAAPVNTEEQMKEAAAALKEENDELSGKAASTSNPEPAAEAEMVFTNCVGMLVVPIRGVPPLNQCRPLHRWSPQ